MNRVFTAAAFADILLLTITAVLGTIVEGTHLFGQHFSLALFTSLLTVLIHVVVFTYFSATGRMISQAVWIGHLDHAPLDRVRHFKARVIRWVAGAVGTIVLVGSLGATCAGDPAWRWGHAAAALLAITVNAGAFYIEYGYIRQNRELMTTVLAAYDAARTARPANPDTAAARPIRTGRAYPERTSQPG